MHVDNVVLGKSNFVGKTTHLRWSMMTDHPRKPLTNPSGRIFLSHQLGSLKFYLQNVDRINGTTWNTAIFSVFRHQRQEPIKLTGPLSEQRATPTATKVETINHRDPWESLVAQLRGIKMQSWDANNEHECYKLPSFLVTCHALLRNMQIKHLHHKSSLIGSQTSSPQVPWTLFP